MPSKSPPAALEACFMDTIARALTAAFGSTIRLDRPDGQLLTAQRETSLLVFASGDLWNQRRDALKPFALRLAEGTALVVLLGSPEDPDITDALRLGVTHILPATPSPIELHLAATRAWELLDARQRALVHERSARRYDYELDELLLIARAMTTERDVNKLLGLILEKSRFITGADAGSVYVVEGDETAPLLRFKLSQNDSMAFDGREFVVPITTQSVAGAAALGKTMIRLDDVYRLPAGSPFAFDPTFDQKTGYLTRSLLVMPLISQRDDVIGVIQLINKKRDPHCRLMPANVAHEVVAFDERSEELLSMLAAHAGVSLETALLYEEIRQLFEGFVNASVAAIEQRDPTTSGHSRRVADLTLTLARLVDAQTHGVYRTVSFDRHDMREIEYASLLHDFGKIGVREKVLVKAKKLSDEDLDLIRNRFDLVARTFEAEVLMRKVQLLEQGAGRDAIGALDRELADHREQLDAALAAILSANEPTVLQAGDFAAIETIARQTFRDLRGGLRPLLTRDEAAALSVRRGSLTPEEYEEIRSHVVHTSRFLEQIPWGKTFRQVPLIAGAHHERLNGTGYPNRWLSEQIPLPSKMMSVADIFDALTASDRPYKKAMPVEQALDILGYEVRDGHLDAELVRLFREGNVWNRPTGA